MNLFLTIFSILSPFIASGLTYYFGIKNKEREIDIEKMKELNVVLSNLLNVWHYLTRIESIIDIKSNDEVSTTFPKKYISILIFNSDILDESCFSELDESMSKLKKYDPIIYYKLEGLGRKVDWMRNQYIAPFLKNLELSDEIIVKSIRPLLDDILDDVEDYLNIVSDSLGNKTSNQVKDFVDEHLSRDVTETLEEFDRKYYEIIIGFIPEEMEKPSFQEFRMLGDNQEFQEFQEIQCKLLFEGKLEELIDVTNKNPELSLKEISQIINKEK